jgi:hypothetical protein
VFVFSKRSLTYNEEQADTHVKAWVKHRGAGTRHQDSSIAQLKWEAQIVEYVSFVYKNTRTHGNSKKDTCSPCLPKDIPILGPRFIPPTYLHEQRRQSSPVVQPQTAYLKPLNIVHPFYYENISRCPQCNSSDIRWDGWTTTGHRMLHGIRGEETALGYQLVCKACEAQYSHTKEHSGEACFCFATTNPNFWKNWQHWSIPRMCSMDI